MTSESMGPNGQECNMPVVFEDHGKVFANSRDVATYFKKSHHHVLRDVRKLIARRPDLNRTKFGLVEHPDEKGEMRPTYDMDRDGFTLLAMGFTGDEALEFKLQYIEAFNRMEVALKGVRITHTLGTEMTEREETEAAKLRFVMETRLTWGEKPAQQMWIKKGLPTVPAMLDGRQPDLFDREG